MNPQLPEHKDAGDNGTPGGPAPEGFLLLSLLQLILSKRGWWAALPSWEVSPLTAPGKETGEEQERLLSISPQSPGSLAHSFPRPPLCPLPHFSSKL